MEFIGSRSLILPSRLALPTLTEELNWEFSSGRIKPKNTLSLAFGLMIAI
jgi:hypothetical protein